MHDDDDDDDDPCWVYSSSHPYVIHISIPESLTTVNC